MKRKLASLALEEDMVKKSLWVLAVVLIGAAIACTLDNPDAPDLAGPSTLARSVEVRAVPDQLISDGFSNSVIEVVLRGPNSERIPGAEIYFDIEGFVDLGNIAPINGARPSLPGVESTAVFATTDGTGVARARYWAPFRSDQPGDTVVTILARETKTNFRQDVFGKADIFLRAADRPFPGPIPVPQPGCDAPSADLQLSQLCASGEIQSRSPIRAIGAGSEAGEAGATIQTYIWSWGDGSSDDITRASSQSHTYSSSLNGRNVTITLTVVNSCGGSAATSETDLEVVAVCPPTVTCPTPSAAFTASGTCASGEILADGTRTTLFDASTSDSGDALETITSFSWSFGDGSTGSGRTTSNMYAAALAGSSATVNLTVTNSCGATAAASTSFVLVDPCP